MHTSSESYTGSPISLAEWFGRQVQRSFHRPAVTFEGETWTYAELQVRIENMATQLAEGGVRVGDRVAFVGFNHPGMLAALFATSHLGAIFVPLNFRLSAPELATIIADAQAHTLIADAHHAAIIDGAKVTLPCSRYIVFDAERDGWHQGDYSNTRGTRVAQIEGRRDDVAMLLYTSGTTGTPKGVMSTNHNVWTSNLAAIMTYEFNSHDVALNCAPLIHAAGLCALALPILMVGGHLVIQRHFEVGSYLDALVNNRVTTTLMVPAVMLFVSQHERFATTDLTHLRLVMTGSAPVPEPLLATFGARNIPVSQLYGLTETTAAVVVLDTEWAFAKLGSCGRPNILTEVRLVDEQGVTINEPRVLGEVCVRGDAISPGYWNRPVETAAAFDNERWLHSGDGAYFDEDGFYYIADRIKDMIISGGENIYPAEIENVLYEHEAIAEVAVVGAPDDRWGERVVVFAALKAENNLTLDELVRFTSARLARYKLPRELHLVAALPRTATGKVVKSELRDRLRSQLRGSARLLDMTG